MPQPVPPRESARGSASHPTPHHIADELKRDDSELWQLLDLLTKSDAPQLLHEVLRRLADLLDADEVALYAGHVPAVLIAVHGRNTFADKHQGVDPRLSQALTNRATVTLHPGDRQHAWQIGPQAVIRAGLWAPSPADATPVVVRVLRMRPEHFPTGTHKLLAIVARRLAEALQRMQQQHFDHARDTERTQLFLVAASIAQELDFEVVAERVVLGITSVTDFTDATIEVRRGSTVRRSAAFGNGELADDVTSPLELWQAAVVEDNRVGQLSYRVPLHNALPATADDPHAETTPGLVTRLETRDGDVLGFLTLSRPRTGADPTEQMVQTIELFAHQAQTALANADLRRRVERAEQERDVAQTLMRVMSAVSQDMETDEVLRICCEAAQRHSAGERASLYLLDEQGRVTLVTSCGRDFRLPQAAEGPRTLTEDRLLTEAVQSQAPVVVNELAESPRYAGSWLARELRLHSVALYPMRAGTETLGVLVVDSHTAAVAFSERETTLLSHIAGQAAVTLRHSSLHAQTREQASRTAQLLDLTTAMTTTLEFPAIFEHIVGAVRKRMDGHAVAVMRVTEPDLHVLGTATGDKLRCPVPALRIPVRQQLRDALGTVWKRGALRVDDVRGSPALAQIARPETRSVLLAAPVDPSETDVLLTVSTTKAAAYSHVHERFLADLVLLIRLAVRNADLLAAPRGNAHRPPARPGNAHNW